MKITTDKGKFKVGCHHLRYFRKDAYPTSVERVFTTIYTSFDRAASAMVDMEKLVEREQPNDVYTFFITSVTAKENAEKETV